MAIDQLIPEMESKNELSFEDIIKICESKYNIPDEYSSNTELLTYVLKEKNYKLAIKFKEEAFSEELISEYGEQLVEYINNQIDSWKSSGINFDLFNLKANRLFFNYCLQKKYHQITPYFWGRCYSNDTIEEYKEIFFIEIKDTIPRGLSFSKTFLEYCIDQGQVEYWSQFDSEVYDINILDKIWTTLYAYIEANGVPSNLGKNQIIHEKLLQKGKYNLVAQMSDTLLTEEVLEQHGSEIVPHIIGNSYTYNISSEILLKYVLKNNIYKLFDSFKSEMYTEEIVEEYGNVILDYFSSTSSYKIKENKYLLDYCLKNKKYQYMPMFSEKIFTDELLEKHSLEILNSISATNIPDIVKHSKAFFITCLENKKFELINGFALSLFTKDILELYGDEILKNLKYINSNKEDSKDLFEFLLAHKRYELVISFPKEYFTEEIINQYGKILLDNITILPACLENNVYFFELCKQHNKANLLIEFDESLLTEEVIESYYDIIEPIFLNARFSIKNKKLFDYCLRKNKIGVLKTFDSSYITADIVEKYGDQIVASFNGKLNWRLNSNKALFNYCLQNKEFDLVLQFSSSLSDNLLTEEIIDEYKEIFLEKVLESGSMPSILKRSKVFFEYCVSQKNINILAFFEKEVLTPAILDKYGHLIIEALKNVTRNSFFYMTNYDTSEELFDYILEHNEPGLLVNFQNKFITKELVQQYGEVFLEELSHRFTINMKSNIHLFRYCFENKKYAQALNFDGTLFTKEIVDKYAFEITSLIQGDIPYALSTNRFIFEWCLENRMDLAIKFRGSLFTSPVCEKYGEKIIEYIGDTIPQDLTDSLSLFFYYMEKKKYDLATQFTESIYNEEILDKYSDVFINYCDNIKYIPTSLATSTIFLKKCISKKRHDLLPKFILTEEIRNNPLLMEKIIQELGLTKEEFSQKIEYLLSKNDEIYSTLIPELLGEKYSSIGLKHLEKMLVYTDVQNKLQQLNTIEIKLVSRILNLIDNEKYDMTAVIYNVLSNLKHYKMLINNINCENITNEELKNLISILQNQQNIYQIENKNDLTNDNYDKKMESYFEKVELDIKNKTITIDQLREALLEKKFGLSLDKAKFLCERYCHNMNSLEKSSISRGTYFILKGINDIYTADNIEYLEFLYITSDRLKTDFYTTISLESSIRKEYAKMFSDTLYQVKEDHLLDEKNSLYLENRAVYEKLTNATFKGQKPTIYIMDGNFNLQIHALGAYRKWERPENFKEDWERPKITHHGICTSYISNSQIANARISHPVYGFSSYEESALLCAGNYVLVSDNSLYQYASSVDKPYTFFTPKEMIDYTRHTHNEMVLERRLNIDGANFKRTPDYVIYFVDDINNLENFSPENQLFSETIQASVDQNIPIIIVDRLKYAKSEYKKCEDMLNYFKITHEEKVLEDLIVTFMNNSIGCAQYGSEQLEYHTYFSVEKFNNFYSEIVGVIKEDINSNEQKIESINELIRVLTLEEEKVKIGNSPASLKHNTNYGIESKIIELETLKKELGQVQSIEITPEEQTIINKKRIIIKYYYTSPQAIQNMIKNDIEQHEDIDKIIEKIKNSEYEKTIRL